MNNLFSLNNKTILVTGASSGIGKAIAVSCSQMGAKVIITGRNSKRLNETYILLKGSGHKQVCSDLTNIAQLKEMVENLPKLDGIVSNAGIIKSLITKISDPDDVEEVFKINTFAPIHLVQFLLQNKKMNKNASIVFISSIAGVYSGSIGSSLYGSSKAALDGFAKSLALEVAPRGIRVNTVNPGMVDTDLFQNTSISQDLLEIDIMNYPLKRYGKPQDIAYAVVYLLSDATEWITGTSLLIDGGFTLK
jgi:NAD(P)-dependent dehydrogenase (short-subunit alcohol dehydrogenase family)